jgi:N utilization substance protein A
MRSEFILAINQLCAERKLPPEVVMEAVSQALVSAYKRNFGATATIDVKIEPGTGDVRVFASKEVVDTVTDPKIQILLAEARQVDPSLQLGQTLQVESTPRDFGRIAAQTAKQVILQRIREAEREALYSSFANSEGEIAHGTIQSIDFHSQDAVVNLDGAEALLPAKEQVSTEKYKRGTRIRAYVLEVRKGSRGPQITLSRRTPAFLRRLLELEVPEIYNGTVEIRSIAREAGSRSKVAVHATQDGVDPVGSCVGVRGQRIQNVVNELGGEKIDVVQWSADPAVFIGNALSPAKVMNVQLQDDSDVGKTATVIVPDRQLSLAIGKEGQNARLAAKLTGWRIDIKSATEAAEETLGRLKDRVIAPEDMDLLSLAEAILQKHEGAVLTAEERQLIDREVDKVAAVQLPWPEAEPVAEPRPRAAGERERTGVAEAGRPDEPFRAEPVQVVAGSTRAAELVLPPAPPLHAAEEEGVEEGAADELEPVPPQRPSYDFEAEQVPTFEGEPVEESSGWVQTPPAEDMYSGWEETLGDAAELQDEWEREEVDVEEVPRAGKKSKKKKGGKVRFVRTRGPEDWK